MRLLNIALTLGRAFLPSIRHRSASGMTHVSSLMLDGRAQRGQNTDDPPKEQQENIIYTYLYEQFVLLIDKQSLGADALGLIQACRQTDDEADAVREATGARWMRKALIETPPLSRSQAEQTG